MWQRRLAREAPDSYFAAVYRLNIAVLDFRRELQRDLDRYFLPILKRLQ